MSALTLPLTRSYLRWRWLAWGAGSGRRAAAAQVRVAAIGAAAFLAAPVFLVRSLLAAGWSVGGVSVACAIVTASVAVAVARAAARSLSGNELFADLGPRAAGVPGVIGLVPGAAAAIACTGALAGHGALSWSASWLPLAAAAGFAVRPRRQATRSDPSARPARRRGAGSASVSTPLRVLAAGALSVPRAGLAIGVLFAGAASGRAAEAAGTPGMAATACAVAAVLAGGLIADPARWLLAAWRYDGTGVLAKAGALIAAWLGAVVGAAIVLASVSGGQASLTAALAAGLGAAVLTWRLAYAGDEGAAWRDGAVVGAAALVAASVMPLAAVLVGLAAAVMAACRAVRRIAPDV